MPLTNYEAEGNMTIDGIDMCREAFAIIGDERGVGGFVQLWADFDVRGEDRLLPSVTGVIAYPRRITAKRFDFRLVVVGDVDAGGTPVSDSRVGLEENLAYIRENVLVPVVSASGTREAVLLLPSGSTMEADIHVLGVVTQQYNLVECGSIWIGTLQTSIPGGQFVYTS